MGSTTTTWSTDIASNRPLHMGASSARRDIKPGTFISAVRSAAASYPDRVQYVLPDGSGQFTTTEFLALSRSVARSLIALSVKPLDAVCILGANAVGWFAVDVGASLAAAIPVGVYASNTPDIVAYIVGHCAAPVFFVGDEDALDKVLSVRDACPALRRVVCWGAFDRAKYVGVCNEAGEKFVLAWEEEFLALGKDGNGVSDADVDARMDIPKPTSVAKLIYTSGTTGPPKAVMLSHDNLHFTLRFVEDVVRPVEGDRMVSYLPASHIAANVTDIITTVATPVTTTLARPDALKGGSLVDTLRDVRPTIFLAVPRVFEKIMEKMLAVGAQSGTVKHVISTWAKGVGTAAAASRDASATEMIRRNNGAGDLEHANSEASMPWGYTLANALVFQTVKKALGLDRCRLLVNAAAPLQQSTLEYFRSLDFQILDMYGMSEGTGPMTFNYPAFRAGTSGRACPGIEVKVLDADDSSEGELCFRGRNNFVGYLHDEEETKSTYDDEGFLHSGDLGRVDEDGFITITGRKKEPLVTAGGENVAPLLVESALLSAMPAISRAFAVGDQRKFIAALLIPYMEATGTLIGPAATINPLVTTATEAQKDGIWEKYLADGVAEANENAISNAAMVKKFKLLDRDFSIETGELTPTMKVKRKVVVQKLDTMINRIYS